MADWLYDWWLPRKGGSLGSIQREWWVWNPKRYWDKSSGK